MTVNEISRINVSILELKTIESRVSSPKPCQYEEHHEFLIAVSTHMWQAKIEVRINFDSLSLQDNSIYKWYLFYFFPVNSSH